MKDKNFKEGIAFVAGGSGGIGAAIVDALAEAGSDVIFTYNNNKTAAELVKQAASEHGAQIDYLQLTLQDNIKTQKCLQDLQQKYGSIHSVIYAAGPGIPVNYASEINFEDWKKTFEQDTHACFSLVQAALPVLKKQGGGSLCAITTTQATKHLPLSVLSSAPKAAIESLFEVVAKENGRYGIRANSIRSGWLAGGKLDRGMDGQMDNEAVKAIAKQVPLGSLGTPEDIANAVVFLASEKGKYINGVNLAVDGGWQL